MNCRQDNLLRKAIIPWLVVAVEWSSILTVGRWVIHSARLWVASVCSVCVVSVLRIVLVPVVQSIVVGSNVEYLWRYRDTGIPANRAENFPCNRVHRASPAYWASKRTRLDSGYFIKLIRSAAHFQTWRRARQNSKGILEWWTTFSVPSRNFKVIWSIVTWISIQHIKIGQSMKLH